MYRPVGSCLLTGPKSRIRRAQVRYWSYWNPASWHWKTIGSYVDPRAYANSTGTTPPVSGIPVPEVVPSVPVSVPPVPEAVSPVPEAVAPVSNDQLLNAIDVSGVDAFPILDTLLATSNNFASISDCSHLITGFANITYPVLGTVDCLHHIGLGWSVALLGVVVPIRIIASVARQIGASKLSKTMFELQLAETFLKLKSDSMSTMSNHYMLKHLGKRREAGFGLPKAYNQVKNFENYCARHCNIDFSEIQKEYDSTKIPMNLKAFFYQQAVAMVAFSYVGYSSKTFSALPLDIHQPLFVFTDPTMYEWSLAVPLCFSAIFTSKALINQHFQGDLTLTSLKQNSGRLATLVIGPGALTAGGFWLFGAPGYTQLAFLFGAMANQSFILLVENHKPTAELFNYKKQGEFEAEFMKQLRKNPEYARLFDHRRAYDDWHGEASGTEELPGLFQRLRDVYDVDWPLQERMSYITTGKRAESKKQILSLYPHEIPESNEEKQAYFRKLGNQEELYLEELRSQEVMRWSSEDRWSSEEQRVERDIKDALLDDDIESESRLAGADTRIRARNLSEFAEKHGDKALRRPASPRSNLSLSNRNHQKEDWEVFIENRDRKYDIVAKAPPKARGPWWETETVNPDSAC